jgi:ribosomal protein S18 acetylase RimI-like enzyme
MTGRPYPDGPAGPFPVPPRTITDGDGRDIRISTAADEIDPLVTMYEQFDPGDRAQGLPPVRTEAIREWVASLLTNGHNIVAWDDDRPVGHALVVPDEQGEYELAIFVLDTHREAGIGTALIRTLLGHAASEGIEHVWLTVERWNEPALSLYRSVGFETVEAASFELEMTLRLSPDSAVESPS